MELFEFYRRDRWPHVFCPGCGNGTVMNCFFRAFNDLDWDLDNTVFVSGIGCSSRIPLYINADALHTTHGRAIAFATGGKMARPDLTVIVVTGDGDATAIGGNHFIHAALRNMDMTVICVNNLLYGMTGGQAGPTTPETAVATTAPYGAFEHPFSLPFLADSCGAVYVARWTSYHVRQLTRAMKEVLQKKDHPCSFYRKGINHDRRVPALPF